MAQLGSSGGSSGRAGNGFLCDCVDLFKDDPSWASTSDARPLAVSGGEETSVALPSTGSGEGVSLPSSSSGKSSRFILSTLIEGVVPRLRAYAEDGVRGSVLSKAGAEYLLP